MPRFLQNAGHVSHRQLNPPQSGKHLRHVSFLEASAILVAPGVLYLGPLEAQVFGGLFELAE
jgi:hypothetical protein